MYLNIMFRARENSSFEDGRILISSFVKIMSQSFGLAQFCFQFFSMPGYVCLRSVDCENFYNLFQMVGAMTHKNDNTINIIFKCINDKSEHEKIKANSNYVNS